MPIVTTKQQKALSDARQVAGDKQERDVAFYLRRSFKDSEDIFVFNDYAFRYNDELYICGHTDVFPRLAE